MTEPLAALQSWMHRALLHPEAATEQSTQDRLLPNARLSAAEALAIYQRSYSLRIAACMREQFPALCHALGEELFNDFVSDYIRAAPPESYTLYDLGRRFEAYLEENRPDRDAQTRESWIDFIVDLARFERVVFATFDCAGAEALPLATDDTPDADLCAQPSLSVGTYRFAVARYYHRVREKHAPAPPSPQTSHVAVLRHAFATTTVNVSAAQAHFLGAMIAGGTVDDALAHVAGATGTELAQVRAAWASEAGVRNTWIAGGFFVRRDGKPVS